MPHSGDILELDLHGFTHDGRSVGRAAGQTPLVVFVRNGLPGQRVQVRLEVVKKNLAEGVTIKVVSPSPHERPAPCIHAGVCGGCAWQSLQYAEQLRQKEHLLADALIRIGKETPNTMLPVLPSPPEEEWGYRNKMEFAFATNKLGLRRAFSHEVEEVTNCLLQSPHAMRVLAALRRIMREADFTALPDPEAGHTRNVAHHTIAHHERAHSRSILRFAVIRELGHEPNAPRVLEIITAPPSPEVATDLRLVGEKLLAAVPELGGFVHTSRQTAAPVAYGEKILCSLGRTDLVASLNLDGHAGPLRMAFGPGVFFQVNTRAAELLYNTATRLALSLFSADEPAKNAVCWDVYCGVGGLTLALAPYFASTLGLENAPDAVALARKNAAAFPECRFVAENANRLGEQFRRRWVPDLLCADPPRSGMAPETAQAILRSRPRCLLLISCNPATLARDLARLAPGYAVRGMQAVDFFPQTPHLETIVALHSRM